VDSRTYIVKVVCGGAVEEDRGGRGLHKIGITAEVDHVEGGHVVDHVVRRDYVWRVRKA